MTKPTKSIIIILGLPNTNGGQWIITSETKKTYFAITQSGYHRRNVYMYPKKDMWKTRVCYDEWAKFLLRWSIYLAQRLTYHVTMIPNTNWNWSSKHECLGLSPKAPVWTRMISKKLRMQMELFSRREGYMPLYVGQNGKRLPLNMCGQNARTCKQTSNEQ